MANQETFFTLSHIDSSSDENNFSLLGLWQKHHVDHGSKPLKYSALKLNYEAVTFDINPVSLSYLLVAYDNGKVSKHNLSTLERLDKEKQLIQTSS